MGRPYMEVFIHKEWCSPVGGCTISFFYAESLYFCGFSRISSINFWSSFSSGMVNSPNLTIPCLDTAGWKMGLPQYAAVPFRYFG